MHTKLREDRCLIHIGREGSGVEWRGEVASDARELESLEVGCRDTDDDLLCYKGDFLDGFNAGQGSEDFEKWVDAQRTRYRSLALRLLDCYGVGAESSGDWQRAFHLGSRALQIDPFWEKGHRRVMRALAARGERAQAIRHYETLTTLLAQEADLKPDRETQATVNEIRAAPTNSVAMRGATLSHPSEADHQHDPERADNAAVIESDPKGAETHSGSLIDESNKLNAIFSTRWRSRLPAIAALAATVGVFALGARVLRSSGHGDMTQNSNLTATATDAHADAAQVSVLCVPVAHFVGEDYPDNTPVEGGQRFVKAWTVRNTGKCAWDSTFSLRYEMSRGPRMSDAIKRVQIHGSVAPGKSYTFSIPMQAPVAPGAYREDWSLRGSDGAIVQVSSSNTVWARIIVPPATAELCTADNAVVKLVAESHPDNTVVTAGTSFTKTWTLRNSGMCSWSSSMFLRYVSSPQGLLSTSQVDVPLGADVPPGATHPMIVVMRAPMTAGVYREDWQLHDGRGEVVPVSGSPILWAQVAVRP